MIISEKILANDIENWFTKNIPARIQLSVLVRILIHSTSKNIQEINFPGNDDAERPGWDGWLQIASGTAWVPVGLSGWEFGVSKNVNKKADEDFEKSIKANEANKRKDITFVFVTPRRWPAKSKWVECKKSLKKWEDVRAYDASDLEQWIEQSSYAKAWFLEKTKPHLLGVRTLDFFWDKWTGEEHEEIYCALFDIFRMEHEKTIISFLEGKGNRNLIVKSDSSIEALAFFRYFFACPSLQICKNRFLVVERPEAVPQIELIEEEIFLISYREDVERELASFRNNRKILIVPKNTICVKSDLTLGPISYDVFYDALRSVAKTEENIYDLSKKSGRSLTVLRRSLSQEPAVRKPIWAGNQKYASALLPFFLAGVWDTENDSDKSVLSRLGKTDFDILEKKFRELLRLEDSPVWLAGQYEGVVSKIDSLFSVAYLLSESDLDCFFEIAKDVLGESNPALDLPETQRYAAALYGKKRKYSDELRRSISETLILLSVHGKQLGFDGESRAGAFVESVLSPFTQKTLEENMNDLPFYAEAAPDCFLRLIEHDLCGAKPEIFGLLRPVQNTFFMACPRLGLLEALEGLAWGNETFARVVNILGKLSCIEIDDNISNKPLNSLNNILFVFYPQTSVKYRLCVKAIEMILDKYPSVGWKICVRQVGFFDRLILFPNYRMTWRFGDSLSESQADHEEDIRPYIKQIIGLMLDRPSYTAEMICDLISKIHFFSESDQERAWCCIEKWKSDCGVGADLLSVWEKIRSTFFSRYGRKIDTNKENRNIVERARRVYESFHLENIVDRYRYIFIDPYFDEFEVICDEFDYKKRVELLREARVKALRGILGEKGISGIVSLAESGRCQRIIGRLIVSDLLGKTLDIKSTLQYLIENENIVVCDDLIAGFFSEIDERTVESILHEFSYEKEFRILKRLFFLLPYRMSTWKILDNIFIDGTDWYWNDVCPVYVYDSPDENNESARRLLSVKRPVAVIGSLHFAVSEIESSLVVGTLEEFVNCEGKNVEKHKIDIHMIENFLRVMDLRYDVGMSKKLELEFLYLEIIFPNGEYDFYNIQSHIEANPQFFVQILVFYYDIYVPDDFYGVSSLPEGRADLRRRAYTLFNVAKCIPGQNEVTAFKKEERLRAWIEKVKDFCELLSCWEKAQYQIGHILSNASVGSDGIWPNEWVRNVMERMQSKHVSQGMCIGKYNARGAHWRGKGGEQERELSRTYREWGNSLQLSHPFVAFSLLSEMAKRYEREAEREDVAEDLRNRL